MGDVELHTMLAKNVSGFLNPSLQRKVVRSGSAEDYDVQGRLNLKIIVAQVTKALAQCGRKGRGAGPDNLRASGRVSDGPGIWRCHSLFV